MHTRQPLRGGYNAFEYSSSSIGVVPQKEPCPSTENTAAPPPKKTEKMLTIHHGMLVSISYTQLKQMGVKGAREHLFPLLFIQKKKDKLLGSSFQVQFLASRFQFPASSFQIPGSRHPERIRKRATKRNLNIGPHPVDIESGPPSEDRVRCRIKSIQPPGSRQQDKDLPLGKKKEFS
ncbi:hypothetical protein YC2023_060427 [Brassica napus]